MNSDNPLCVIATRVAYIARAGGVIDDSDAYARMNITLSFTIVMESKVLNCSRFR